MEIFSSLTSTFIPLSIDDVDTDMIIPARHLRNTGRTGYGAFAFENLRRDNPTFPIGNPVYAGAAILVAGNNFGCGSSREHAVWALREIGVRVVIAESFADIFRNNAEKNGLLPVVAERRVIEKLWQVTVPESAIITVDLPTQTVTIDALDTSFVFTCDPFRKHCLLKGFSDVDYLLSHKEEIARHFQEVGTRRFLRIE
jgi:3-isopropylmalate/(R)-2-methylmalate dehydratase small subunit